MLKTYFRIALHNLAKAPVSTAIKLAGLAVGVSGCLIIFLIARYELSFDKFQPDRDRIYRVYSRFTGLWDAYNRGVPLALPAKVRNEFTGLDAVTYFQTYSAKVSVPDSTGARKKFENQSPLAITGPEYFSVFDFYEWTAGNPKDLEAPFTVVLTEKKALNYFGTTDPDKVVGKPITYSDSLDLTVVGIVKDIKERTDFEFTDFISFATIEASWLKSNNDFNDWGSVNSSSQCFIKLSRETKLATIEQQIPILMKAKQDQSKDVETKTEYKLQPLGDLHYNLDLFIFDFSSSAVSLGTMKTLGTIALLLLVIAVINFVNLETAQAVRRAKEVGLRKVMGGSRYSLMMHFLAESLFVSSVAVLLAIPLCYACFTFFGEFLPKGLAFTMADPFMWSFLALTSLVVGGLAGIYPAFVLSSYRPVVALKNQVVSGGQSRSAYLRKILTVMQFSFSQVLIVGALIVSMQISFMINKDLGFARNEIVYFSTPWWERSGKVDIVLNELSKIPEITAISRSTRMPISNGWSSTTVKYNNGKEELPFTVHVKSGDTSYLSVFQLKLLAGRNVQPSDSVKELLINETFCKKMGLDPRDALNIQLKMGSDRLYTVVGVLADFHFQSLHKSIEPMYYRYESGARTLALQLALAGNELKNVEQTLAKINEAINTVYPGEKIECQFFNESIEKLYRSEQRVAKLTNIATGLAIFISCLGLFGLASYTAVQRTKEIGIRKVLGSTVSNIVVLVSREFLLLVMIAFVIAVPVAWYAADRWLGDFAFRVDMGIWVFVLAGTLSVLIAFLTVGSQALKAAVTDPVESLRYE